MAETIQDLTTLDGRRDWVATARVTAKVIAIVGAALIALITSAVTAYRAAVSVATSKAEATVAATKAELQTKPEAQVRKDESEASFQALLKWKAEIDRRLPIVERAVAKAAGRKPAKAVPKPFPTSTAQALAQLRASAPLPPNGPPTNHLPPDASPP